jgi:hypothetical protein
MKGACVGRLGGIAEIFLFGPVFGEIGLRVEAADGNAGNRGKARVAVLVEIDAGGGTDGMLGRFLKRGGKRLLGPTLLRGGRVTLLENVSDGTFSDLRLRRLFFHANPSALL